METIAIFLLALILIILFIIKSLQQKYTKEGIPIVGNIPWLGCAIQLKRRGARFIREQRQKHGDIFQLYVGGRTFYFLFDDSFYYLFYNAPESEMSFYGGIKDNSRQFPFDAILGVKTETEEEKQEVSAVKPIRSFLQDHRSKFVETFMHPHYDYFFQYAKDDQRITSNGEFTAELMDFTLFLTIGMGASTLAGFKVASDPKYLGQVKNLEQSSEEIMTRHRNFTKKAKEVCAIARNTMREVIDQAIINHETSPLAEYALNTFYTSTGRKYGVREAGYTVFGMIFATMANTRNSMVNAIADILARPEIKEKVMEELNDVIVKDPRNANVSDGNYFIDQEMVDRLQFLLCCLTETLRMTASPMHLRRSQVDLVSPDGTLLIPNGSFVCTSPWIQQREERMYERPDEYDPSRFAKGNKQKRLSFITFGNGRHYCLGKQLAETIIRYVIARLFLSYDIQLVEDQISSKVDHSKLLWIGFGVRKSTVPVYARFTPRF